MATKTVGTTGADYATWADYVVYLKTLGTLTATETGQLLDGEFNGGNAQFTGAGCTPTASFPLIIEPAPGAKFSGNPLRYGDGARSLFDGNTEEFHIGWAHTTVRDLAFKKTSTNGTSALGIVSVASNIVVTLQNIIAEADGSCNIACFDDRAAAASPAREHLVAVVDGINSIAGILCRNYNKEYRNCSAHAFGSPTGGTGLQQIYSVATWINCESLGFATDVSASYGASSKNCATSKASGSSNISGMTAAQFDAVGATEHEAWGTYGSHDLRVKSTSVDLLDLGAASGGTTTDIIGQAISNTTRDIGPWEYQSGGGSPEIVVSGNSVTIADGDATPSSTDHTDFGSVVQGGTAVQRVFTVQNTGTADLTTSGLSVPSGFSIVEGLSATIAASSSDTFTVSLPTTTVGTFSGDISFTNNDSDEGTFNFAVTGEITAPPPPPPPPPPGGSSFTTNILVPIWGVTRSPIIGV